MSLSMIGDIKNYTKNCRILNIHFTYAGKESKGHMHRSG